VNLDKLAVIYCGHDHLNDPKIYPQEPDIKMLENVTGNKPFFFTAGASYPHKNVNKIIEAMQTLPGYNLIITGPKNTYYTQLKEAVERRKQENIIFMNYVSDGFLKLLYKKCVANIYISSYEGFGSTPLEAAMNDKISIVSNKTALPEIYGKSVLYVDPDNTDEIKNVLLSVASPQFNSNVYKSKFPDLIKKYSWVNTANGIMKVILPVLGNKESKQTLVDANTIR
jgi:glycosyltransferase involved in cell wall biosynthesis